MRNAVWTPRCVVSTGLVVALCAVTFSGCIEPPPDRRPSAEFTASPTAGFPNLTVRFQDASSMGGSPILAWTWSFGDGTFASIPNPIHTYTRPGTYTVSLTVTNAFGSDTETKNNFIVLDTPSEQEAIGPAGGAANIKGVGIAVPAGVLAREVVYSATIEESAPALNSPDPATVVSRTFLLQHNNSTDRLYAIGLGGNVQSATLTLPYDQAAVPLADRVNAKVQVLVETSDAKSLLLFGQVTNSTITVPVTALPAEARYAVVYRPGAFDRARTFAAKAPTAFNWGAHWLVNFSPQMLQQLTALRIGGLNTPNIYSLRNFTQAELNATEAEILLALEIIHNQLSSSGLRSPLLSQAGGYRLAFCNFTANYDPAYENFRDLTLWTRQFGQILIDPRQLLNVARHNANALAENEDGSEDLAQEVGFGGSFAQALYWAAFDGYDYPDITRPDADGRPQHFLAAFAEGLGTFLAQRFDGVSFARSFGANERARLGVPLFYPVTGNAGYAVAAQDFFKHLDLAFGLAGNLDYLTSNDSLNPGVLEAMRIALAAADKATLGFGQALRIARGAADAALTARLGAGIGDIFDTYARDLAIENGPAAQLRPSDAAREAFTLNTDRFDADSLLRTRFAAPVDAFTLSAATEAVLNVPPLAVRAVVLEVSPLASDVTLTFNVDAWTADDSGQSLAVTVYRKGVPGIELVPGADTIYLPGFYEDPDTCVNEVVILLRNRNRSEAQAVTIAAESRAQLDTDESLVLDQYVHACDPDAGYTLQSTATVPALGVRTAVLRLNSGAWRGPNDVNASGSWSHLLTLIQPPVVTANTALLLISGGDTNANPSGLELAAPFAVASGSIVAVLQAVPNQPLRFSDDNVSRREDAIIAYSYDKYLTGVESAETDRTWPALLPMTRAAVRAMDSITDYMLNQADRPANINRFVVAGASKRGWTTWLTAAADPRVVGIIPIVIDVLNMDEQMTHHKRAYGGVYSNAVQDYVNANVFDRLGTPQGQSLLDIVDPFSYLSRLTMPKLIANATGDQFFLPDSWKFYLNSLPGETSLYYAPNTDHGLQSNNGPAIDEGTANTILAWYIALLRDIERPVVTGAFVSGVPAPGTNATYRVTATLPPNRATLWQANSPSRDFRLETIGPAWESSTLSPADSTGLTYNAVFSAPAAGSGWRAYYVTLSYAAPAGLGDIEYSISTPIQVLPDLYPDQIP